MRPGVLLAAFAFQILLLAGPALVRETIAGMDATQLHARPIPDKMTTHDVVTHIVDSERGMGGRIKRAIAGEEPPLMQGKGGHPEPVFDSERDLNADLEQLVTARKQMAEELRQLPPDVWERAENHVAAIEEKRAALGL